MNSSLHGNTVNRLMYTMDDGGHFMLTETNLKSGTFLKTSLDNLAHTIVSQIVL